LFYLSVHTFVFFVLLNSSVVDPDPLVSTDLDPAPYPSFFS